MSKLLLVFFLFACAFPVPALDAVLLYTNSEVTQSKSAANSADQVSIDSVIDAELLNEVIGVARKHHIDGVVLDKKKITELVLKGFMQSLDKHSYFLTPEESAGQDERISGVVNGGIGVLLMSVKRYPKIDKIYSDSPAEKVGLKAGDKVVEIDGVPAKNLSIEEVVKRVRGPIETKVVLKVVRKGEFAPLLFKVTRGTFTNKTVSHKIISRSVAGKTKKIGILKIEAFDDNTWDQFQAECAVLIKQKPDLLMFDLRDNHGGSTQSVAQILGDVVGTGKLIFSEEYWNGSTSDRTSYSYFEKGIFDGSGIDLGKVVCLINEGTASSGEIMSAGLHDVMGVKLIGETTYGKGTAWLPVGLKSGRGTCNVTCLRWYTPKHKNVTEVGIEPDIEVEMDETDVVLGRDPQMDAAIKELLKK